MMTDLQTLAALVDYHVLVLHHDLAGALGRLERQVAQLQEHVTKLEIEVGQGRGSKF